MSEGPAEVELPHLGTDAAFGTLMDTLVADEEAEAPGTDAAPATPEAGEAPGSDVGDGDSAGGADQDDSAAPTDSGGGEGAGADTGAGAPADSDADGGGGGEAAADADAGSRGGDRVPAGTVDYTAVSGDLGKLSQAFEETTSKAFQQQALEAVKEEYVPYFEALKRHPRLLVGEQVPDLNNPDPDAMETLRDAQDAQQWQEAVKSLLAEEVQERARQAMDENKDIIGTVHASIELFTQNKDLVPGTKQFDRALADRFAAVAKPYELRVDGRLHGYTIPVQPLIDQLRTQLTAERKAKPAAAPAAAAPAKASPKPKDGPQRGIRSKAGSGSEGEDYAALFGTLGFDRDISR